MRVGPAASPSRAPPPLRAIGPPSRLTLACSFRGLGHRSPGRRAATCSKERKTYARCQACVKGALASKSHRGRHAKPQTPPP
jgi:hypothetical protein